MSNILVIGAAHLDISGDYDASVSNVIDKPGEIIYSVGGTGYNIAANLAQNGAYVEFITLLRQESLITPIISSRLASYGIKSCTITKEGIGESGFIAQRQDGKLTSAVTASSMEQFLISDIDFDKAVSSSDFVICDCNISSIVINRITQICSLHSKKLCISAVSQAKARRIVEIDRDENGSKFPIFILAMNSDEAKVLCVEYKTNYDRIEIIDICIRLGSEYVIITAEKNGYIVLSNAGEYSIYQAPMIPKIVSHSGAGDALFAAVCWYYAKNKKLNWPDINKVIARFVGEVMKHRGATVGSITFPNELSVVQKSEYEELKRISEAKSSGLYEKIVSITKHRKKEIILAVVGIIIAAVALFFELENAFISGHH